MIQIVLLVTILIEPGVTLKSNWELGQPFANLETCQDALIGDWFRGDIAYEVGQILADLERNKRRISGYIILCEDGQ